MTTPKSSFSQTRTFSCYMETLKQNLGTGMFYGALSFIFLPLQYILTILNNAPEMLDRQLFGYAMCFNGVAAFFFTALTLMAAVIIPTNILSYMHSRRAVDVYHSLPYKRSELLVGTTAAGLTLLCVPVIINFLVMLPFSLKVPGASMGIMLLEMLCWIVAIAVTYMFTVFASVQVGSVFDTSVFSLVLNGSLPAVMLLVMALSEMFLYGFSDDSLFELIYLLSPVSTVIGRMAFDARDTVMIAENNIAMLVWAVVAVVFLFLSIYFYDKRKSEQAEVLGTLGLLSIFVRAVGTLLAGCLIGVAFVAVFEITHKLAILACIFVGASIAYVIGDVILARSVKGLKKAAPWTALMAIGTTVFVAIFLYGGLGFEKKIPDASEVKSVTVKNYYGRFSPSNSIRGDLVLTNEESIETVIAVHSAHLDFYEEHKATANPFDVDYTLPRDGRTYRMTIVYELENGQTLTRGYNLGADDVGEELLTLETTPEYVMMTSGLFDMTGEIVDSAEIYNAVGDRATDLKLSSDDADLLIQALRLDVINQTAEELSSAKALGHIGLVVRIDRWQEGEAVYDKFGRETTYAIAEDSVAIMGADDNNRYYYNHYSYSITESFENTLRVLDDLGYSDALINDTENFKSAYIGLYYSGHYSTVINDAVITPGDDLTGMIFSNDEGNVFKPLSLAEYEKLSPYMVNVYFADEPMALVAIENTLNENRIMGHYYVPLSALDPALAEELKIRTYQIHGEWMLQENYIEVTEEWRELHATQNNKY